MKSLFLCLLLVSTAFGWGKEGHMIVAKIAAGRLSSAATNGVTNFIGTNTLAWIAPQPDNYDHSPAGKWSEPCHFVNMPNGATSFSIAADCASGCCVVTAILNYTSILAKEVQNPVQCNFAQGVEPCALEFLVHYVGDVHQPLHVGWARDLGGNTVQVDFFGKPTELHAVWDDWIIEKWTRSYYDATDQLNEYITNNPSEVNGYLAQMNPSIWANESFSYVLDDVYNFNPSNKRQTPDLTEAYYNHNLPIIKSRLVAAGVRLGQLLNQIFGGN